MLIYNPVKRGVAFMLCIFCSVYLQFKGILFLSVSSNLGILAPIIIQSVEKIESITNFPDFSSIGNSVTIVLLRTLALKIYVAKNAEVHHFIGNNRNKLATR